VRHLGEFGVVFLMFAIGLEFSLPKLRAMRKQVFGLGLMQVLLTMAVVTVGWRWRCRTGWAACGTWAGRRRWRCRACWP
jgi:Kef-type K+ transport system membrane component KefB